MVYAKAVVMQRNYIVRCFDALIKDYVSGMGVAPMDWLDDEMVKLYLNPHASGADGLPDVFCTPRPANFVWENQCFDITGSFHGTLESTELENELISYPASSALSALVEWNHKSSKDIPQRDASYKSCDSVGEMKFGTVCFQGHQFVYGQTKHRDTHIVFNHIVIILIKLCLCPG